MLAYISGRENSSLFYMPHFSELQFLKGKPAYLVCDELWLREIC